VPGVCAKAPDLSNLRRASVLLSTSCITLTGHGPIQPPPTTIPSIQYFLSLQFAIDWEVNFHITGNWEELTQEVIHGKGYVVSDGSFKTHKGAAAWIIEGSCSSNWIIGECFAPGHDDDHSSFRSELAGIYTCLLFIYHCFPHNLQIKPTFYLACDGKSMLHRLWNLRMTSASEPHYDLLLGNCWLLSEGWFIFTLAHVKGHQDNGAITVLT